MAASQEKITPFFLIDDYDQTILEKLRAFVKEASVEGMTGLYKAVKTKQFAFANVLIHYHDANIHLAFFIALQEQEFDLAVVLLQQYHADINWVSNGWTILQHAVNELPLSAWEFLLKNKAATIIHEDQDSILHFILELDYRFLSETQKIARIKILLAEYPDMVHHKNNEGVTPLHLAYDRQHFDIIHLLLERGADANSMDRHGLTPSDYTPKYGSQTWLMTCMVAMGFAVEQGGMCLGYSFSNMQAFFLECYYHNNDQHRNHFNERLFLLFHHFAVPAFKKFGNPLSNTLTEAENQGVVAEIKRLFSELQQEHPHIYADIKDFFYKVCIGQSPYEYTHLFEAEKRPYAQKDILLTLPVTEPTEIKELGGTKKIISYIEIYTQEKLTETLTQLRSIATLTHSPIGLMLYNNVHVIFLGFDPIKNAWQLGDASCYPPQTIFTIEDSADSTVAKKIEEQLKKISYRIFLVEIYCVGQNYEKLSNALFTSNCFRLELDYHRIADLCHNDIESITALWDLATKFNNSIIATKLLNEGYCPNIALASNGHTPLSMALICNSLQTLEVLLASGKVNWYILFEGKTLLHCFVANGRARAVIALLHYVSHDHNLLYFMHFNPAAEVTPLELAIKNSAYEIVRTFLDNPHFCTVVFYNNAQFVTHYFNSALQHGQSSSDWMNALKIVKLILSHPNVPITPNWVEAQKSAWQNLPPELKKEIETTISMRFLSSGSTATIFGFFTAKNKDKTATENQCRLDIEFSII